MNLQESIRRILREETEYFKDVRVKISDILKTNRDGQSLDDAIVNVQDGLKSYSEGPPFLLKIGDKYEVLDGFHRIAQKILDGKKYIISDVMIKESNMNLQESIRRILMEEGIKSNFFLRRIKFDDVKERLPINTEMVYYDTETYDEFKYLLTLTAVEEIMWNDYKIHWEDLPEKEEIEFVTELSNKFEKTIRRLYNIYENK